ncbi:hypothetical protein [Candidatus Cyanaurora vandensis]|uniref:hypothetical protein n=1 Tax=Candidatus Cyanaurora vandensis TaxID=2714958 RepID=UPI0037BE2467
MHLRWRYQGKQYTLSLGLPVTPPNQKLAQIKAHQSELDLTLPRLKLEVLRRS